MRKPRVKICRRGRAHLGEIEMPMQGGSITVQTLGWDPMSAIRRAGAAAMQITSDPRIAPFLPPQVTAAVMTVRILSKLSKHGLKEAAETSEDPATRKLATAMLKKADQAEGEEVGASRPRRASNPKYRVDPIKRGPQSQPRKYTGKQHRKGGRPAPRGLPKQVRVIPGGATAMQAMDPNAMNQPPVDQYGNPIPVDQYGTPLPQYGQPGSYPPGVNPSDPNDFAAMQAWGASAFDQKSELQPEDEADSYFAQYEDSYFEGSQEDAMEYEEEPIESDHDNIVDQDSGMRDEQPAEPEAQS